jgi:pimeloyl-ACP methyl ester carboxylesterase
MDMPGFGGSPIPKKTFGIGDYAEVVIDFIDKLKLKNVVLIGHSFGGKIGTVVAAKSNKVRKLVLVGASGIAERSLGRRVKKYLSKIFKPIYRVLPSFLGERIFEALVSDDYRNAGKLKSIFQKIVSQNVEKEAGEIRIPTLIVWGDKDKEVPLSSAKKFEKLIADSYVRIIWNTGHDSFLEKPNKFLEILEEFLYD